MFLFRKYMTQRALLGLSTLLFVILLTACGGGGSTGSSTPTPQPVTPTPSPAVTLKTYTGSGYTIDYPQDWKVQNVSGQVIFTDALGVDALRIAATPNPNGIEKPSVVLDLALTGLEKLLFKNAQPASDVPATATVGEETWTQRGVTGTVSANGQDVPGKLVVLADNHPANSPSTYAYTIAYGGPSLTFDTANSAFQAMLQSFKFTA